MTMFCPNCGSPDQTPETYCRRCGEMQRDFAKPGKRLVTVQGYLLTNVFFGAASALFCLILLISDIVEYSRGATDFSTFAHINVLILVELWLLASVYWGYQLIRRRAQGNSDDLSSRTIRKESFEPSKFLNESRVGDQAEQPTRHFTDKVPR